MFSTVEIRNLGNQEDIAKRVWINVLRDEPCSHITFTSHLLLHTANPNKILKYFEVGDLYIYPYSSRDSLVEENKDFFLRLFHILTEESLFASDPPSFRRRLIVEILNYYGKGETVIKGIVLHELAQSNLQQFLHLGHEIHLAKESLPPLNREIEELLAQIPYQDYFSYIRILLSFVYNVQGLSEQEEGLELKELAERNYKRKLSHSRDSDSCIIL